VSAFTSRWRRQSTSSTESFFVKRPFLPVWLVVGAISLSAVIAALYLLFQIDLDEPKTYPLVTGLVATVAVAAASWGWAIGGWVAHRNARIQHTLTIIAARFAQPMFVQQMTLFNNSFGDADDSPKVTSDVINALIDTGDANDQAKVQSARYFLNYFEFIASGVRSGELDLDIVCNNLRSSVRYFHDKCEPYIDDQRKMIPTLLSNFTRLKLHLDAS
jgi:hypothetical protein